METDDFGAVRPPDGDDVCVSRADAVRESLPRNSRNVMHSPGVGNPTPEASRWPKLDLNALLLARERSETCCFQKTKKRERIQLILLL